MKKIILFAGIAICILTACKDKNVFTLTGTFENDEMDGKIVYLQQLDSTFRRTDAIDSAKVENGKFLFKGIAKELPEVKFIIIDNNIPPVKFIPEKGKIEINFDIELNATIKGTAMNDQYQLFETKRMSGFNMSPARIKYEEIKKAGDLSLEQFLEFDKTFKQDENEWKAGIFNFIKPIITTQAGQYFFLDNSYYLDDNQQKELISLFTPEFKNLERIKKIEKWIDSRELTAAGKQFTDVKGFDFYGKEVKLSDYAGKGKIVLVDFWASWCGPCISDMPDVIALYQKYNKKGFEIVGISLDSSKENWKKSTDDLKISWPQFSNLKGWEEDCSVAYGVNSIPHTVLIDKDGIIIERGLRGESLKFKLEELLGN